jgi:hypothetical protein
MFNRRAQSTLEYAIIIAVVMAGLWFMQHYLKRGYQGKLRDAADQMGEQYDPAAYTSHFTLLQNSTVEQRNLNKVQNTNYTQNQINSKIGNENLTAWQNTTNVYGN